MFVCILYICVCVCVCVCTYACMHAKSLQLCPTLCDYGQQPTRLLCPQDSLGKNTGVGCRFLLQYIHIHIYNMKNFRP